jgi:hypothetical protein
MPREVSNEELAAAMAEAVDEDGNDTRLAESVAEMTPEERRQSEENLRRSIAQAQASLRRQRDDSDL